MYLAAMGLYIIKKKLSITGERGIVRTFVK